MYTGASDAYKSVITQDIRPTSQFQAEIDAFDSNAEDGLTFSFTGMTSGSSTSGWPGPESFTSIATFEPGRMVVGSDQCPGSSSTSIQYLTSNLLSDEDGDFSTPPTLTLLFANTTPVEGVVFEFAEAYATEVQITQFRSGVQVAQFVEENDQMIYSSYGSQYVDCDSITVEFLKINVPLHRLRLLMVRLGLVLILNNENVSSVTYSAEVDPISSTMSRYSLMINVIDEDGRFNPDNPNGIWDRFKVQQRVVASMGTLVGDDAELVPLVPLYLTGAPVVSKRSATFEAVDALQTFLTVPFQPVRQTSPTMTLYSLIGYATRPLVDAGLSCDIDYNLYLVTTSAPIEYLTSSRDALQMAANAGRCVVYITSDGVVHVKRQDSSATLSGYHLTYDEMFDKPRLDVKSPIKQIDVYWYRSTVSDSASVIYEGDLVFEEGVPITIGVPCAANISVTSTLAIRSDYEASYNNVVLEPEENGTSHVVITGKSFTNDAFSVTVPVSREGETITLDNQLVTTPEMAQRLGEWIAGHYLFRQAYDGNLRQDYLLEANDPIELETDYGEVPIRVYRIEYSIPGQRGVYEGRRIADAN